MTKGLVSIITPCYNGEKYIERYLKSILNQTYQHLELIIVNDGSNDKTEEIILSYKNQFENLNINLIYIYQENRGQAEAINQGLKIFKGEYLTWPDADDTLEPTSIEEKVNFLNNNKQYGFVRTKANVIDEKTNKIINTLGPKNEKNIKEYLFEDLIFENDVWYAPGCYMVKTKQFINSNPRKHIYASRGGQNWQMLLPVAYKYKCGYIPKCLYNYYYRENSHSHKNQNDYEKQLKKINEYNNILLTVLQEMNLLDKYEKRLEIKYEKKRFALAFAHNNKKMLHIEFKNLKDNRSITVKILLMYIIRKK